jgi:hypothetical protein
VTRGGLVPLDPTRLPTVSLLQEFGNQDVILTAADISI